MSQEADSGTVYEEPIEIPLEEEDDDDEEEDDVGEAAADSRADTQDDAHPEDHEEVDEGDGDPEGEGEGDADGEGDGDAEGEEDMHGTASRSGTATPLSHGHTGEGDEDDMEDDEVDEDDGDENGKRRASREKFKKYPKLDPTKAPPGKKVPLHLLEKRRLGRIKAAEEFAKKLKKIGIEKVESNTLPSTGLFQPMLLINQKNYSSDYLKKDEQVFALRERKVLRNNTQVSSMANTPDVADLKKENGQAELNETNGDEDIDLSDANTTLVIHPGSDSIKIGFAKDETPMVIPACVAIPKSDLFGEVSNQESERNPYGRQQPADFEELKSDIQHSFKERMRFYKRKVQPNAHEQVVTFNKQSKPEYIEEKNDFNRINWITTPDRRYYGKDALRCSKDHFIVRRPFVKGGSFNIESSDYRSLQDLLGDVTGLLEYALGSQHFELKPSQFSQYKLVLVIPDLFEKSHVETFIGCLITELQFQAVAIIQESLATCYGAGISTSTCVVNIGATQTRIACVDEGTVLENSAITLDYGSDDITRLFAIFLLQSDFPYQDWDIESAHGWLLAQELKKNYITFQDANVTVQLYNFIKRIPGKKAEKYDFKVFDEVMLAPLSLFYPEIVEQLQSESSPKVSNTKLQDQLPVSRDIFTDNLNDWRSMSQAECLNGKLYCGVQDDFQTLCKVLDSQSKVEESQTENITVADTRKNYAPLEKAVVQSITNASLFLDIAKMAPFYSNILVCGGGSKIPALDFILTDRINIWRPRLLSQNSFPTFYKKLAKQIKDIKTAGKNSEGKTSALPEEDQSQEKVNDVIQKEFQKYMETMEAQGNGDHTLPVSVLPPPRDMDPAMLVWKGASVLAQIKLVEELYLTGTDWDIHGSRILQYKCIFTY
ncbi:ARP8 (YOR141C) [Zygosaccharomyces parabailii]|nr:ARP8 (YOR141C) [Zygosaccharomyces parabailii]CDH12008.1 related to Actin-like protein ARP8 [Zygosaccharomyces bailii ISA1307]